jgi:hypothetical protein
MELHVVRFISVPSCNECSQTLTVVISLHLNTLKFSHDISFYMIIQNMLLMIIIISRYRLIFASYSRIIFMLYTRNLQVTWWLSAEELNFDSRQGFPGFSHDFTPSGTVQICIDLVCKEAESLSVWYFPLRLNSLTDFLCDHPFFRLFSKYYFPRYIGAEIAHSILWLLYALDDRELILCRYRNDFFSQCPCQPCDPANFISMGVVTLYPG